jgi:hypothetical protein
MAKTDLMTDATDPIAAPDLSALRMGQTVSVTVAPGLTLRNTESGGLFEAGAPTPQTVTPTLLRRLRDGDLVLVA